MDAPPGNRRERFADGLTAILERSPADVALVAGSPIDLAQDPESSSLSEAASTIGLRSSWEPGSPQPPRVPLTLVGTQEDPRHGDATPAAACRRVARGAARGRRRDDAAPRGATEQSARRRGRARERRRRGHLAALASGGSRRCSACAPRRAPTACRARPPRPAAGRPRAARESHALQLVDRGELTTGCTAASGSR